MEKSSFPWVPIITATVALYGAILSTINSLRESKKNRRSIKVELSTGFFTYDDNSLSKELYLFITIINPGLKTVNLNTPELHLKHKKKLIITHPQSNVKFPLALEEGKNATVWLSYSQLFSALKGNGLNGKVKFRGAIQDQTGKLYIGKKPMQFDLNKNYQ